MILLANDIITEPEHLLEVNIKEVTCLLSMSDSVLRMDLCSKVFSLLAGNVLGHKLPLRGSQLTQV